MERHRLQNINFNLLETPYRTGYPIDYVPTAIVDEEGNLFVKRRDAYQSLVGQLTWLATNTRPNLTTAVSFLVQQLPQQTAPGSLPLCGPIHTLHHVPRYRVPLLRICRHIRLPKLPSLS